MANKAAQCGHLSGTASRGHTAKNDFTHVYLFVDRPTLTSSCNFLLDAIDSSLDNAQVSLPWIVACNHMKSVAYFTSSINSPCAMKAFPCDNWQDFQKGKCFSCDGACPQMGYNADQHRANKRVLAFLETVEDKPFCGK